MSVQRRFFLRTSLLGVAALAACKNPADAARWAGFLPPAASVGPFVAPSSAALAPLRHLLDRCTFGPRPEDLRMLLDLGSTDEARIDNFLDRQLAPDELDDPMADWATRRLETLREPAGELFEYQPRLLADELERGTILRAVYSTRQLLEVIVGFWSDHFNIDQSKGDCKWLKVADDRDIIRPRALGRFSELLRASATSPAMLWYLDGRVNKRASETEKPNENYARELMELHTLGVDGGYTQRDVMEVARCLTGWTVRSEQAFFKGRVEFHPELHDDGVKEVLGQHIPAGLGAEDLDRVVAIICDHPSTARFIATKLCRRFIADDPPNAAVAAVADSYRASGGSIEAMLRSLFDSTAFWSSAGGKFKRPFRFAVSALRATGARTDATALTTYLLRLGQAPFQYPTPDGYADVGPAWQDTLMWRWELAAALADGRLAATSVAKDALRRGFGSEGALWAHVLGRAPDGDELQMLSDSESPLALALSSPAFQRY